MLRILARELLGFFVFTLLVGGFVFGGMVASAAIEKRFTTGHVPPRFLERSFPGGKTYPLKWGTLRADGVTVLSYRFYERGADLKSAKVRLRCDEGTLPLEDGLHKSYHTVREFKAEVIRAMQLWSSVAKIDFIEATSVAESDLLIAFGVERQSFHGKLFRRIAAFATFSDERREDVPDVYEMREAILCFNQDIAWGDSSSWLRWSVGTHLIAAHEIGHAIGFDHVEEGRSLMRTNALVMHDTLGVGDIQGAQKLYGAR